MNELQSDLVAHCMRLESELSELTKKLAEQQAVNYGRKVIGWIGHNHKFISLPEHATKHDTPVFTLDLDAPHEELTKLLAEARKVPEEIERDAKRYQWLRNKQEFPEYFIGVESDMHKNRWALMGAEADAAIDKAMLSAAPKGGMSDE